MTRIGVAGSTGRTGRLVEGEILEQGAHFAGGIGRTGDLAALARLSDVVIDFTRAETVVRHATVLAAAGVAWVVGTTGLSAEDERALAVAARAVPVVRAANFSLGVAVLLRLARQAAAALPGFDAEIVEMHHAGKRDAPSGTALALADAVAEARGTTLAQVRRPAAEGRAGAAAGSIGIAALRGGGVAGDHALVLAGTHEVLTLSHRALDRRVFAAGAVRAARWVAGRPPGLYGMEDVLEGMDA